VTEKLTPAQARILAEVHEAGMKTYNGHASRAVKRLEHLGLVNVNWEMDLVTKGNGVSTVWRITVTPRGERLGGQV
jgi:hypothetical protein